MPLILCTITIYTFLFYWYNYYIIYSLIKEHPMKKKILSLFLALLIMISSMPLNVIPVGAEDLSGACGVNGDNVTFTYNEKTMCLTISGTGDMANYAGGDTPWYDVINYIDTVVIEDGVTGIGDYAFCEGYSMTSVTLPDSVTKIGAAAFSECYSLMGISIPESVVFIDSSAFSYCYSFTEVFIPESVTTLGNSVFYGCGELQKIEVAEDNPSYADIDGVLFNKEGTKLIQYPVSKKGDFYKIPDGVTEIGAYGFSMCRNLIGIEIPESMTAIGADAFNMNFSLFYVIIPEEVTSIGVGAFAECYSLSHVLCKGASFEKIDVAENNELFLKAAIHSGATGNEVEKQTKKEVSCTSAGEISYICKLCDTVIYSETVERLSHSFVDGVCELCGNLEADLIESDHPYSDNCDETKVIYKEGAKWIKVSFSENTYTEMCDYIYIYDGEDNEIGSYSDSQLAGRSVGVPGDTVKIRLVSDVSVTFYGYEIVSVEYSLEECTHPMTQVVGSRQPYCAMEGYTGDTVCAECGLLMSSGESVAPLGHSFNGDYCTRCGISIFNYGYLSDENGNFYGIEVMNYNGADTDVVVPSEIDGYPVVRIGTWAFSSRTNVTSITLPDSITGIGSAAFDGCTSLKSINLPEGLTDLGDQTFNNCSSLESIDIPDGVTYIGDWAFQNCTSLRSITIPDSVTSFGYYAFSNCRSLESINIPEGITSIGEWQFSHCDSLKHVVLPENVKFIDEYAFYSCDSLLSVTFKGVETIEKEAFAWCVSLGSITVPESLKTVGDAVFASCSDFNHIYYAGSESAWNEISISSTLNSNITNAEIHFEATGAEIESLRVEPSCTKLGENGAVCTICNEKIYAEVLISLPHEFTDGACELCGNLEADLIESDHPYSENCDETKTIYKEGAKRIRVTFSEDTFAEWHNGRIYVYDGSDNEIGSYTGTELASKTVVVFGDTVKVRLTSGSSGDTCYGYRVISVTAYYEDCTHPETTVVGSREPGCDYYGYTGDTICTECMQVVEQGQSIAPTGHTYEGNYCTKCGAYVYSYYFINNDNGDTLGVGIGGYYGTEAELNIPAYIEGYPVLEIGFNSFAYNNSFTKITLPETLTTIEGQAFYGCASLESISIPDSVNYIGRSAFCECSSLKSIIIPSGVTFIDEWTFGHCYALESIELCGSITSVGAYSFYYCQKLESIAFNEGLTSIGDNAFYGCEKLTEATLPEGLVSIENSAFSNCVKLERINLPDSIEAIGSYAFSGCYALAEITIPESLSVISEGTFWGCGFTSLIIPEGVEAIGSSAFASCSELRYIVLPESVSVIDNGVFGSTYNLKHVFYGGSEEAFGAISVAEYNEYFEKSVVHYDAPEANVTAYVTEPTCIKSGTKTVSCGICNEEIYTEILPVLSHSFTDGVCELCGNLKADLLESEHPYPDNVDETKTIYKEGAKWIKLIFSEESYLQGDDTLYIYDGEDNEIYSFRNDFGGREIAVFSDTVKLRLVTDGEVTDYGYALCSVTAYYEDCTHPSTEFKWGYEPTCEASGYTGEEWCLECLQMVNSGEVIDALGHDFVENICTHCGENIYSYEYIYENEVIVAVKITGYRGDEFSLVIPFEIGGYPVAVIGEYAFASLEHIESIVLPDTVEAIETGAFASCHNLESITLPDSLVSIGDNTFNSCYSLTSITVPNGITTIEPDTFAYCYDLEKVVLSENLIRIGEAAFYECESLTEIELPESLLYIDARAFAYCYDLAGIELPIALSSIGDKAFYECSSLSYVVMSEGVASVGESAFDYCYDLDHLLYTGTEESLGSISIGECNDYLIGRTIHFGASENDIEKTFVEATCTKAGKEIIHCTLCDSTLGSVLMSELPHEFRDGVCVNCGNIEAYLIGSSHPYTDNCNETQKLYIEGAHYITVTFSSLTQTESGWDYIGIYNASGELLEYKSGTELAGQSITVPGDTVIITLTSDSSNTAYGYSLVSVEYCNSDEVRIENRTEPTCTSYGYTGDTVCTACGHTVYGEEISPLGHNYENDVCTRCGVTLFSYGYEYSENGEVIGITILSYSGTSENVIIPSEIDGYSVTGIGSYSFWLNTSLVSVTIPDSVEEIGYAAFGECPALATVYYAGTVLKWNSISIGDYNSPLLNAEFVFSGILCGDVDGDGDIYLRDLLLIRKYIAGLIDEEGIDISAADIDRDSKITLSDVLYLRKYLAGIITEIPA